MEPARAQAATQIRLDPSWKLSPKQARFVAEYVKDLNATQAAIRAGYSKKWANENAHRLTVNDGIQQAVRAVREAFFQSQIASAAEALAITSCVMRVRSTHFYDDKGNLLPVSEWTDEMSLAVAGMEVVIKNAEAGDGVTDRVLKLKLGDRLKAADMMNRHHGSYAAEKVQVSGELSVVETRLLAARKRAAEEGQ